MGEGGGARRKKRRGGYAERSRGRYERRGKGDGSGQRGRRRSRRNRYQSEKGGDGRHRRGGGTVTPLADVIVVVDVIFGMAVVLFLVVGIVRIPLRILGCWGVVCCCGDRNGGGDALAVVAMKTDPPPFSMPVVGLCHHGGREHGPPWKSWSVVVKRDMRSSLRAFIVYPHTPRESVRIQ